MTWQSFGPEGPVGVWILLVFPCLFVAILLLFFVAKGRLDAIPGGPLVQLAVAAGVFITFSIALFGTLAQLSGLIQGVLIAIPYLILAGCAAVIHQVSLPDSRLVHWMVAIVFGGAGLAGWVLAGTGIFQYVQKDLQRSAMRAQEERAQEEQRRQWEMAEFAKLDDSAPLHALLQFTRARNEQVRQQARLRVGRYPGLDNALIELLDRDYDEAISYIARRYENPPATLAPAWGKMLERQLKKWDGLQFDEHAGTWEQNLKVYFEGAQKLQIAGGSLRKELILWHQHLQKCKGLGNLATFVKNLLETESKS